MGSSLPLVADGGGGKNKTLQLIFSPTIKYQLVFSCLRPQETAHTAWWTGVRKEDTAPENLL